jgi:phenylpyruvate tautomerase PptA (4-oxalocrotonate tautomerase family)
MPLIEIKSLPPRSGADPSAALKNATWEVSKVLGVAPEKIRAVWVALEPGHYADAATLADASQSGTHPPVVHLSCFEGRPPELIEKVVRAVADSVGRDLKVAPGNVWVYYEELKAGRLFVDGAIKR